ncbi:hypothetical protein IV72_GL001032 [Atopobium minutum]|nr:hypothetical protein IV72_GL001032 [Atopobium minutum]
MTKATVAANLHQAGYVLTNLTTKVTLDGVVSVDGVTKPCYFVLSKISYMSIWIYSSSFTNFRSAGAANAVDIS